MKLTKIDVVRRQLETAVMLYFNDGDPVSIHTLVAACNEMLSALNKRKGPELLALHEGLTDKPELKKKIREALLGAKNFFKHADRDTDEIFDFNPSQNEFWLIDCCEKFLALMGEENPHFIAFRGWFTTLHPDIFPELQKVNEGLKGTKLDFYKGILAAAAERRSAGFYPNLNQ